MKRRSFLAMIGMAPITGVAASASSKVLDGEILPPEPNSTSGGPFIFEDRLLKIKPANIGAIKFGKIKSHDGSMMFDLGSGLIDFLRRG